MWTYNNVIETFVEYFKNKDHHYIPTSSVVPDNDKSLLFTNSGMVQFKNIFLGNNEPVFNKVCNSQKCIRAGGKHNDLDDVGKDSYHHTYFQMLGNWSFNYDTDNKNDSYFKKESIDMAWDLLINVYELDKNNMYVTYFSGNDELGIDADHETRELWLRYMPEDKILPFGMKENFWEMGSIGPCGPCTEIHYDRIGGREAQGLVNKDDPSVIEIWNLVFMQYNRQEDGSLKNLLKKHIDTGMGAERLTSLLQNCTNYQIDHYKNIINIIKKVTSGPVYEDKYGPDDPKYVNIAYRVIADHTQTLIVALNDGVTPGAFGREHVIRRLIRRAIRYGEKLNAPQGFYTNLVDDLISYLSTNDTSILSNRDYILKIVNKEEKSFEKIMRVCLRKFYNFITYNKTTTENLFMLYVSHGFPQDIIQQLCEENKILFDNVKWNELHNAHIQRSKN